MIEVSNLTKIYTQGVETIKAVDNVSFTINRGEMLSIIGHSGSGKTTLLSLVGGLTRPTSGLVKIDGIDIWTLNDDKLSEFRNKRISFIYQFSSLVPTLTVLENVVLPTAFGVYDEGIEEYAQEFLGTVGLKDKMNLYPSQLSGGQQRRVAIARAFINKPDIVLADEPTGDLDEDTEKEMMRFFRTMNEKEGVTFIMVTHNTELARQTRRQLRMSNGNLSCL